MTEMEQEKRVSLNADVMLRRALDLKAKDNKLIAEFMDWTEDFDSITHEGNKWWSDPNTHKYHTSWDWLMPVIIKMADIREDTHYKLYKTIDEAYQEVVEFINQLNN